MYFINCVVAPSIIIKLKAKCDNELFPDLEPDLDIQT